MKIVVIVAFPQSVSHCKKNISVQFVCKITQNTLLELNTVFKIYASAYTCVNEL